MPIRAVFFSAGETLGDETRQWVAWSGWLGVPHLTFFALLGAVIARGEHHRTVFDLLKPGFDLQQEQAARAAAGATYTFNRTDFYPDAIPCLEALRAARFRIGIAGNQPSDAEEALRSLGLPVDVLASPERWGVEKPSPAFFARLAAVWCSRRT